MADMDTGAVSSKEKSGKKAVKTANKDTPDPKIRKRKDDKKKLSVGKSISSDITVETVYEGPVSESPRSNPQTQVTPAKNQRVDNDSTSGSTSVFKSAANLFKIKESVDNKVSGDLADMVNCIFREGISDEKYNEFLKEIKRPENCTSLTKTRVNNLMWD